jgi:4-aminobutyrate aminotransferase-like enzyme
MIGIECTTPEVSLSTTRRLLERGYVLLPSGDGGRVLSLTPPLSIGRTAILAACDAIAKGLLEAETGIGAEAAAVLEGRPCP